ncbi:hypothetical protein [Rufibacter aurantiacus]|uniref:hypothetical protein n=1 Tax=Rufibacter aurantiacus TaxID=2817374 RepID=UPI001B312BF8|nr:hypothetical protein [Rufibacter aurantiacus]
MKKIRIASGVIFTIALIVLATNSFSQNITASTEDIVKKIRNQPSLLLNHRLTRKNIRLANKLSEKASDSELINLIGSEDGKVACLAFLLLKKKNHSALDSIYNAFSSRPLEEIRMINRYNNKWKGHNILLESDENFIFEVYNKGRYLENLK